MGSHKEPSTYEKQLVALGRVLQALREGEDADDLLRTTLSYLQAEFSYTFIWIGLYDRVDHCLYSKHGVTPTGDPVFAKTQVMMQPGDLLEQVVIQQRPIGVPDLRDEARAGSWREVARRFDIQGTIIFPMRYRDRCVGVAVLGSQLWGVSPQAEEKARLAMILGELAAALCQLENEQQRQQVKDPMHSFLRLLAQLRSLPTLEKRLEAIVKETHQFLGAERTNIYWFEPQRRYFWRRVSQQKHHPGLGEAASPDLEIPVEEVSSFYQTLVADQTVMVGEAQSSLRVDMTARLMHKIRAQSLLAVPILFHDQLLGFLDLEGNAAKIWSDSEKHYAQVAAQLAALTAPLETMEVTIQQIKLDQELTAEISQAIHSTEEWNTVLKQCADRLCQRLDVERFLVLLYDADQEKFEICYQNQPSNRRLIPSPLERLNQVDWQMLERSNEAVGIENLADDLKLMAWREVFLEEGVQSLLVCNTSVGNPLEGLLVIGHENTRAWNRVERDILRVVGRQIGLILHQWQLQRQTEQQERAYQTIQWGLSAMQQIHSLEQLEHDAMQQLSKVLQVPLAALVTWLPGRTTAKVAAAAVANNHFSLTTEKTISIHTDYLIQWALQTDGLLPLSSDDLSPETRQWLSGSGIGQILVMALRTAAGHEPTGLVFVADRPDRYWPERQLNAFSTLVCQLAWSRRYLLLTQTLLQRRQGLEQLNWYKQRYIEELYRTLGVGVRRLNELSHQKDALASMRYHQILRQFGDLLSSMVPILKQEQWQIQKEYATIPLASLLRRSLERVDHLIKQRQIWSQVHNEEALMVGGDIPKLEFVIYEVLLFACRRSPQNGRLDLWCRPMDENWLELSITDNGIVEPRLVEELNMAEPIDLLAPSTLENPPGLHLVICQWLMKQLGGEFSLFTLEDGRTLSRLVIAIATEVPPKTRS